MKERPKGVANIQEVDGDKDIIVVITTGDFNGKYARECRENIFKGLHIVFVESGGRGDFYFNSAYNINVGVKKAMEYNPKWVIYSGDDMIKVDPISKLVNELEKIDYKNTYAVFTHPARYHSAPMFLGRPNLFFIFALKVLYVFSKRFSYIEKTYFQLRRFNKQLFFPRYIYSPTLSYKIVNFFFFKKIETFNNTLSFGIFSSNFVRTSGGSLFDDNYINEMEDTDLSMRLKYMKHKTSIIDFEINEYVGSTIGNGGVRTLKVVPGWTYFYYKMDNGGFKK
jgi:hypothetical protein